MTIHARLLAASIVCAPHAEVADSLKTGFDETPVGVGITTEGNIVEVWAPPDGQTWTLTVTGRSNLACVLAAGTVLILKQVRPTPTE